MFGKEKSIEQYDNGCLFQNADGQYLSIKKNTYFPQTRKFKLYQSTRYINVIVGSNGNAKMPRNGELVDTKKKLPELYRFREQCCGCSACMAACPLSETTNPCAITMLPDEEGFLYPVVDVSICVRCYKCMNVCGMNR